MEKYIIKNAEDRKQICAIFADNGFTVRITTVKDGKRTSKAVEVWKDEEKEN